LPGRRAYLPLIAGATLLALLLRVHTLAGANPWFDEGFTYWLASLDIPGMLLRTAGDTHPPLSYLLYHGWLAAAGRSVFALRYLSVVFGVAAVPVCAAAARRLGGQWAGAIAAFVLATSRFHIYWSQQIRMYALVALLVALSTYLLLRLLSAWDNTRPHAVRLLLALGAVNLAGLYSLYFFAVLVLFETVLLVIALPGGRFGRADGPFCHAERREASVLGVRIPRFARNDKGGARNDKGISASVLGAWAGVQLASLALLAPWLLFFRQHAIRFTPPPGPALSFGQFVEATWSELALGIDTDVSAHRPLLIVVAVLTLVLLWEVGSRRVAWWLALTLAGLPLAAYGITLQRGLFFAATYQTRYDLLALPALVLLLAWGTVRMPGWSRLAPPIVFAGVALSTLPSMYYTRHRTDDYQSLARFVEAYEQPGDVIIFDPDKNFHLFLLDYQGKLPWDAIPLNQQVDASYANQLFNRWTGRYRGLWLLQEDQGHDAGATQPVHDWLNAHLHQTLRLAVADRVVTLYEPAGAPLRAINPAFRPQHLLSSVPGLLGFDQLIQDGRVGDVVDVALYGPRPPDTLRVGGQAIIGRVQPGRVDFAIPVGTWLPDGWQPLIAVLPDSRAVGLSSLYIEPDVRDIPPPGPPRAHVLGAKFGGLAELISWDAATSGQQLTVHFQWIGLAPFARNYTVFVHLLDAGGRVVAQRDSQPQDGQLPTVGWPLGQPLDDSYSMDLPKGLEPGAYSIDVGLYWQADGSRLPVSNDPAQDHVNLGSISLS